MNDFLAKNPNLKNLKKIGGREGKGRGGDWGQQQA